jgi:hypothetical protein
MAQSTITRTARRIHGGEVWDCSSGYSGNLKTKGPALAPGDRKYTWRCLNRLIVREGSRAVCSKRNIRIRKNQHPRQMLGTLPSSSLPCSLTVALAERRDLVAANRVRFIFTARCTGNVRKAAGGDTVGGITGLIAGGGIAGTLAALPMPLGSLIEPLSPRAFAGPGGMPLTPASWAGDIAGAARRPRSATLTNAALPAIHPREKIETSCARFIKVILSRLVISIGRTWKDMPKFPRCVVNWV